MIREYQPEDLRALLAMHAQQGFDYEFPRLDDPLFFTTLVLEGRAGPEMALAMRHTCEAFYWLDPRAGTPLERWRKFLRLHAAMEAKVKEEFGLEDAHAFLPPEIERRFGKRLRMLGWVRDPWPCYSKILTVPELGAAQAQDAVEVA